MIVLVRRGDVRAAIASVLPHAGKESEDTPELGRVRFVPTAESLLVWATDHGTAVVASARVTGHVDGELDGWDLSAQTCKQVLAVFQGPSNPDARMMWEDQDLRIELTEEQVVLSEDGGMVPGRDRLLRVPRVLTAGEDRYPDVPRTLHHVLDDPYRSVASPGQSYAISVEALAKLVPSAKAWSSHVTLNRLGASVLARCGERFLGLVPTLRVDFADEDAATRDRATRREWADRLEPLRRPERVTPTPEQLTDLARQAGDLLSQGGGVLRVVRNGGDTEPVDLEPLDHDDGRPDDQDIEP